MLQIILTDLKCDLKRPNPSPYKTHGGPQTLSMSAWRRWSPDALRARVSSLPIRRRAVISFARLKVTVKLSQWHSIGLIIGKLVLRRHGFPSRNAEAICRRSQTVSGCSSPLPSSQAATTRRLRRQEKVLATCMTSPLGSGRPRSN